MHLIVCIDEANGMSFCGRRLSSDRLVTAHILNIASGGKLWMNRYSSGLFSKQDIIVDEAFWEKAGVGDFCFVENIPVPADTQKIESVIVYHWNRRYPSTVKFPAEILADREVVETIEFAGYSHERITMKRYCQ